MLMMLLLLLLLLPDSGGERSLPRAATGSVNLVLCSVFVMLAGD
jgi:hypothetical protein